MSFHKNKDKMHKTIDSLIGAKTHIIGDVRFEGGLRIDGKVKGDVVSTDHNSLLIVGEAGSIEGSVKVDYLFISGTIKGPVEVDEMLELESNARIHGDVYYNMLEMHRGAVIEGTFCHRVSEQNPASPAKSGQVKSIASNDAAQEAVG